MKGEGSNMDNRNQWQETIYSKHSKERIYAIIENLDSAVVKSVVKKAFNKVSEGFWHVPASSTGKYHPLYACGDSGLARHTIATIHFAERFAVSENWDKTTTDYVIAALLLHDTCKLGVHFEERYTLFEHPILVILLLDKTELTSDEFNVWIVLNTLISSHMGKWCTPSQRDMQYNIDRIRANFAKVGLTGTTLPIPNTEIAKMVAHCDYLAADKACMLNIFNEDKGAWEL